MNRAHEVEAAATASLDFLDEIAAFGDTAARRGEARKHADAIRFAMQLPLPRSGVEVPTWRKFVLWNDYNMDTDRPQTETVDVRKVISVREVERRRAYGANSPVAILLLEGGREIAVADYDRRTVLVARERDYLSADEARLQGMA